MSEKTRPSTPPPPSTSTNPQAAKTTLSPDQLRRIEANRQKALEIQARLRGNKTNTPDTNATSSNPPSSAAGQKRPHDSTTTSSSGAPTTPTKKPNSSATTSHSPSNTRLSNRDGRQPLPLTLAPPLRPSSKKLSTYVDYDFSKMTDTKGGFLSEPSSTTTTSSRPPILPTPQQPILPTGPPSPNQQTCTHCPSTTLDPLLLSTFRHPVCPRCKLLYPDAYSLLTKTECREDYLITDPELADPLLLPHLTKPNPHKSTWNDMHLYLRCQVEDRAKEKWGGLEGLDREWERRCKEKKERREKNFKKKLRELKSRTRVETWKREGKGAEGGGARGKRHEHVWGTAVDREGGGGLVARTCVECGFEVEELVL